MNRTGFHNARIIDPSQNLDTIGAIVVEDGLVVSCGPGGPVDASNSHDCSGKLVLPGLVDSRVFVGEPGAEHRETIASASEAAAAGGVTSLIMMPDTAPVIDDVALVEFVLRTAREQAKVNIYPSAALTKGLKGGELTEFGLLRDAGAVMLTDGRNTLANNLVLRRALTYARDFDLVVACETQDDTLAAMGVMNEGLFASWLGLEGIPKEAEIIPLERDLRLAGLTGAKYHAAKISTAESIEVISAARNRGVQVTCGVSINHISLNENDIGEYRTFFRLSPPLRGEDDRRALVSALQSGDIDIIVSSHDPQDVDTKRLPFADAADGAIGLETLLASALRLHHNGDVPLLRLIDALSTRPAQIFGLDAGSLKPGGPADLVVVDPDEPWVVSESA
ncbi:MAG: dihydroorotase, partial [Pseudomonadota bacterium]